jgi:hypothetical protein
VRNHVGLLGRNVFIAASICTSTSHFFDPQQGSRFPAKKYIFIYCPPHIRLMVDVLLTTNEAFCIAGVSFLLRRTTNNGGASEISEKKHD